MLQHKQGRSNNREMSLRNIEICLFNTKLIRPYFTGHFAAHYLLYIVKYCNSILCYVTQLP